MQALVEQAVQALVQARRQSGVTDASQHMLTQSEEAYAVQDGVAQALGFFSGLPPDEAPRHWKSGGPGRTAVLTHAALPPAGVVASPADLRTWPFQLRGIEAEIALRLREDVDAQRAATLEPAAAAALIDAMCVSIELVDTRWREGLAAPALAKLADQQAHGALVLSAWQPFRALDWAAQRCIVQIGERPVMAFTGTHSLGDPTWLLPTWLRHATRNGAVVRAGTVVTTGTWCGLPLAEAGEQVSAEFPGVGRASVQL